MTRKPPTRPRRRPPAPEVEPPEQEDEGVISKVLYLDTETTGVDTKTCHPVEVALLLTTYKGKERHAEEKLDVIVKPPEPCSFEAMAVHHITHKMVEDKPTLLELAPQVMPLVEQADFVVAHNAPFDMEILERTAAYAFIKDEKQRFTINTLDTLRLAHHMWNDLPSYKLQVLRYRFGLDDRDDLQELAKSDPHRAMFDTLLLRLLVEWLWLTGDQFETVEQMVTLSHKPYTVGVFPFGKHFGTKVEDVVKNDPSYVLWCLSQDWLATERPDLRWTLEKLYQA